MIKKLKRSLKEERNQFYYCVVFNVLSWWIGGSLYWEWKKEAYVAHERKKEDFSLIVIECLIFKKFPYFLKVFIFVIKKSSFETFFEAKREKFVHFINNFFPFDCTIFATFSNLLHMINIEVQCCISRFYIVKTLKSFEIIICLEKCFRLRYHPVISQKVSQGLLWSIPYQRNWFSCE